MLAASQKMRREISLMTLIIFQIDDVQLSQGLNVWSSLFVQEPA